MYANSLRPRKANGRSSRWEGGASSVRACAHGLRVAISGDFRIDARSTLRITSHMSVSYLAYARRSSEL
jgi:hypothetical protein